MTAAKRRVLRMLCKGLLLISLPLVGFVWALPENSNMMIGAGVLTALSLLVAFGAEYLATATETELQAFGARIAGQGERRAHEIGIRDESIRQFDRIVNMLTEQNNTLRAKLIAAQVDLQNKKDELVHAAGQAISLGDVGQPAFQAARAR